MLTGVQHNHPFFHKALNTQKWNFLINFNRDISNSGDLSCTITCDKTVISSIPQQIKLFGFCTSLPLCRLHSHQISLMDLRSWPHWTELNFLSDPIMCRSVHTTRRNVVKTLYSAYYSVWYQIQNFWVTHSNWRSFLNLRSVWTYLHITIQAKFVRKKTGHGNKIGQFSVARQ